MDEDPMAYLNAKRKEMEAIAEMAAVAQLQHDLAMKVSTRMEKINSLLDSPKTSPSNRNNNGHNSLNENSTKSNDPEVEFWRKKLAELSEPVEGVNESSSSSSPYSSPNRYQNNNNNNASPLRSSPHLAAVLARDSSNVERHKLLQSDSNEKNDDDLNISNNSDFKFIYNPDRSEYPPLKVSERLNLARSASKQIEEELYSSSSSSSSHQPLSPPSRSNLNINNNQPPKYIPSPRSEIHRNNHQEDNDYNEGKYTKKNEDPEVEYWRKKIAELSGPSSSSSTSGGYHSSSLPADMSPSLRSTMGQSPPSRPNLRNPRYKAHSLADEALSWEGTASYASENSKESPIKKEEATGGGGGGGGGSRGEESSYDVSPPSSPSSSRWRSEVKQLFNGEEEYYSRK